MAAYFHRDGTMDLLTGISTGVGELTESNMEFFDITEEDRNARGVSLIKVDTYAEAADTIDLSKLNINELFDGKTVPEFLTDLREEVENLYNHGEPDSDILSLEQGMYIGAYNPDLLTDDQFDTRVKLGICGNRFQYREV